MILHNVADLQTVGNGMTLERKMIKGEEAGDLRITLVLTRPLLSLLAKPSTFLPALTSLADAKATIRLLIDWKKY